MKFGNICDCVEMQEIIVCLCLMIRMFIKFMAVELILCIKKITTSDVEDIITS